MTNRTGPIHSQKQSEVGSLFLLYMLILLNQNEVQASKSAELKTTLIRTNLKAPFRMKNGPKGLLFCGFTCL